MGISVNPELENYLGYFFRQPSIDKALSILHELPANRVTLQDTLGLSEKNAERKLTALRNDAHIVNYVKTKETAQETGLPLNTWYVDYNRLSDHLGRLRRQLRYALKGN